MTCRIFPPAPRAQRACPASKRAAARPAPADGQAAAPAVAVTPTARALAASSVSGLENLVPSMRSPPVRGVSGMGGPELAKHWRETFRGAHHGGRLNLTRSGRLRRPAICLLPSPQPHLPLPWPACAAADVLPSAQSGPAACATGVPPA